MKENQLEAFDIDEYQQLEVLVIVIFRGEHGRPCGEIYLGDKLYIVLNFFDILDLPNIILEI